MNNDFQPVNGAIIDNILTKNHNEKMLDYTHSFFTTLNTNMTD